ncbi:FBP domain-containing protein [Nocardia panacis]|uniref:FBP domain-containing protein n=1 Tax=Nocardia panacis TaxID=2340916 RepID=A0A3A4JMM1_9NOCA|nr:FBP domain-containing protein [Nocardia panacis]RJO70011.1 FBP domain-containing protein [Nocardia panacis]
MRPMTRDEVRAAIVNTDPPGSRVRLPTWFDEIDWDRLEYLGWRDQRSPRRVYLVTEIDGAAVGVLLEQTPTRAELGSRAMMCDLCRSSRRFNEVALFTARRPSKDRRQRLSGRGLHLCADLDCNVNANRKPSVGRYDPATDELIADRRAGLRARTAAFLVATSETQQTVRRPR